MKLIQVRFRDFSPRAARAAGMAVERMLVERGDTDLTVRFLETPHSSEATFRKIGVDEVASLVDSAMTTLASRQVHYPDAVTIRSNRTCRLIVPEDDGLLRIRIPQLDDPPDFGPLACEVEDASSLLIETDLFDFF